MNNTPRWLWVILVSSVQLVLLLIAVVIQFAWISDWSSDMMAQQTCLDNHMLGQLIAEAIEEENIRDIRSSAAKDRLKLESIIASAGAPITGFVSVVDYGTERTICQFPTGHELADDSFEGHEIYALSNHTRLGTIQESISNQPQQRHFSCRMDWAGQQHFVSAQFLPQLNAILLIGQPQSLASGDLARMMKRSKIVSFAVTLLIGMIGTCLTVVIITRIGNTVDSVTVDLEQVVTNSAQELVRTKNAVIFGLAKLAESRDNDTGEHLERIRTYVTILSREIAGQHVEFDDDYIHQLGLASSLHDIGKVGIPDSILLKPGRLTPEERGIMEIHTLIGGECLDAIHARLGENEFMHIARQIAYYHHERWDGTGYPHSLKGTEIPLVARIVAVADVYDALTSKRPYKKAMSHLESKEIIVSGSGKHFDPEIVEAFLLHEADFEEIALQQQFISDEDATSSFQRLCEAVKA